MDNFQKLSDGKWDLIFEEKDHTAIPAKFKLLTKAVSNRSNIIILVKGRTNEQPVVYGGFTNKGFPVLGDTLV